MLVVLFLRMHFFRRD